MDILSQYQQEHPEVFSQKPAEKSPGGTIFVRGLMRISGGRVRDARQAQMLLVIASAICIALATVITISSLGVPEQPPRGFEGDIPRTAEYGFSNAENE